MSWLIRKVKDGTYGTALEGAGLILYNELSDAVKALLADIKVEVTENDSTPGNLSAKLAAGEGIAFSVLNPGGNEQMAVKSLGLAKVSSDDTTLNYLFNKLVAGSNISLTIKNPGADETYEVAATLSSHVGLHLGWIYETEASASVRTDETAWDLDSTHLNAATGSLKHIVHRPDTSAAGSQGLIQSIGQNGDMSTEQWALIHGLLFCISVEDNNWFNLKNNATVNDGNYKKIKTGTESDLYFLKSALLAYDNDAACWYVISTTRATWQRTESVSGIGNRDELVADNLPQIGYYFFDVRVEVDEDQQNTTAAQELFIKGGGLTLSIDKSANLNWGGPAGGIFLNHSLQGSGIIYINNAAVADREIYLYVTLPNNAITSFTGYAHFRFLGKNIVY